MTMAENHKKLAELKIVKQKINDFGIQAAELKKTEEIK